MPRIVTVLTFVALLLAAAVVGRLVPAGSAQEAADLAGHPLVGTWAVPSPVEIVPQTFGPDGSVVVAYPANYVDPQLGLTFQGPALGRWEAVDERSGRLTVLQALSDAAGTYVGTLQLSATIEASADGQTWSNVGGPRIITRDGANNVTFDQVLPAPDGLSTATRIGASAESVVLPGTAPAAATPTA